MNKLVSAIIVNWNGKHHLDECIISLQKQSYRPIEIIIMDNDSKDGSREYVRKNYPDVKIINTRGNLGLGLAVNEGYKIAKGEYVIYLNEDLYLDKNCIKSMVDMCVSGGNMCAVVPTLLFYSHPKKINASAVHVNYLGFTWCKDYKKTYKKKKYFPEPILAGGIVLYNRKLLKDLEGFDKLFWLYHSDTDYCINFALKGYPIFLDNNAKIYHKFDFNRNSQKLFLAEKNRWLLLLKTYQLKTLLIISPMLALSEIAVWGQALLGGWFKDKIKSYFEIWKMRKQIRNHRRQRQRTRMRGGDKVFKDHLVGNLNIPYYKNPLLKYVLSPIVAIYWKLVKWMI